jgi:hypothetical protein
VQIHESPNLHPLPDTPAGDAARDRFLASFFAICGDVRLLWMPRSGETTTTTDRSRNALTLTYSKDVTTFDTPPYILGSGFAVDFDGVDEEADTPNTNLLTFGDGDSDEPFSVIALVNFTDATSSTFFAKHANNQSEWIFQTDTSDQPVLFLYDQSAGANIKNRDATALAEGSWVFLACTYDGSADPNGIRVYVDGVSLADTPASSGTYTAMENLTGTGTLGHYDASGMAAPMDGAMALVAVVAQQLIADDMWAIKELMNTFYDLSL